MKIVYNACFGGYSLSDRAALEVASRKGWTLYPEEDRYGVVTLWKVPKSERTGILSESEWNSASQVVRIASNARYGELVFEPRDLVRTDPDLIAVVEALGDAANGPHAELKIADVPSGARYRIDEYDGRESVMTVDDYEWQTAQ